MKIKFIISSLLASFIFSLVVCNVSATATTTVATSASSISQFIEMLISIGVIAPDKAMAARAAIAGLNQVSAPTDIVATSTSYLQILSPDGGEIWNIDAGVPYSIVWGSAGLTKVNVALVASNNSVCNLSQTPVNSKDGTNSFGIFLKNAKCFNLTTGSSTSLTDGSYKARVSYTDVVGTIIKDESNAVFKILPVPIPSLKITYPNGGDKLLSNRSYDVKYTILNVDSALDDLIYLDLVDNSGNVAYNSHKLLLSGGVYSLSIPSSVSAGAYKIKLYLTTNKRAQIEDSSDNFFWISDPV